MEVLRQGRFVIEKVFAPKEGEKVLIITDKSKYELSEIVAKIFKELNTQVTLWLIPESLRPLKELNTTLRHLLSQTDITLYLFSRRFDEKIFRTDLAKSAREFGRVCMLTGIEKGLKDCIQADFDLVKKRNSFLMKELLKADHFQVSCANGSKASFKIDKNSFRSLHGQVKKKGEFDSLPTGQLIFCPEKESFNGRLMAQLIEEDFFEKPIILEFQKGALENHSMDFKEADKYVKELKKMHECGDVFAKSISTIAIGTNDLCGKNKNILESSKSSGAIQFSLGDALGLSRTKSRLRMDLCLPQCDLKVDNAYWIKDGKFVPGFFDSIK